MKAEADLAKRILDTLPSCMHKIVVRIRTSQKRGMTFPQFRILGGIAHGLKHVMEMATLHGVSQPAMSKMVNGLVKRGFVERLPRGGDRRKIELALTRKGRRAFLGTRKGVEMQLEHRISNLTPGEKSDLARGLAQLRNLFLDGERK
ncbi:MAG: MarR family transcriptional regulator [Pseudomonadota bacterium]